MTNYTLSNHLQYSVGGREFGYREQPWEQYKVTMGSVDPDIYRTSNWREELKRTADSVYKEFGKDLVVFLSGGTDSEIVVRNFLEIGVKPKCAIIKFDGNYNDYDVLEAQKIAVELDLDLEILDFDVIDFHMSGEAKEFGAAIQCPQVTYLTVYHNILKLGAPAVMGGELLLSKKIKQNPEWYYTFRELEDASAMRFSELYNLPLVNEWFSYTPEMVLYYLEHPTIVDLVNNKIEYKLSSVSSKNRILQGLYPDTRRKLKTHGFERLRAFNFESYHEIWRSFVKRTESTIDGIVIEDCLKMLRSRL